MDRTARCQWSVWGGATAAVAVEDRDLKGTIDPGDLATTDNSVVFWIPFADLEQGGQKIINGMIQRVRLQEFFAAQRKILLGWIALDATTDGNEQETNTGRNTIWRNIWAWVLRSVFGIGSQFAAASPGGTLDDTLGFMPLTYPCARNAADTESLATVGDDIEGIAFFDRLEAGIRSSPGWDAARHERGVPLRCQWPELSALQRQGCSEVNRNLEGGSAVFSSREERLFVGFDTTDYARFGFWRRGYRTSAARAGYVTDNSTSGDIGSRNNGFAFSPLAAAI